MSKTLTISQTFGAVVGIAQTTWLDTDFTAVATFCNDPASKLAYANDTGAANAIVFTLSPAVAILATYVSVWFQALANNTGASTITVNPVPGTAKSIKVSAPTGLVDPVANNIVAGQIYGVIYAATPDVWILINPSQPAACASLAGPNFTTVTYNYTGNLNTSAVVTSMSSTVGLVPGMSVSGTGIPSNDTIFSVDSPTQITMTVATAGSATGVSLTFVGYPTAPTASLGDNTTKLATTGFVQTAAGAAAAATKMYSFFNFT